MIQIVQKGTDPFVLFFKNDYLCGRFAIVAQLVERWLPKPKVAGSCPVYRSWKGFQKLELFPFLSAWEAKGLSDSSLPARLSRRSRDRAPSIAHKKGSERSLFQFLIPNSLSGLVLWA